MLDHSPKSAVGFTSEDSFPFQLHVRNIYLSDQKAVLVHFVSGFPLFMTDKIPGFIQVFPSNFQVI